MSDATVLADFPEATRTDWLKRVEAVIKGAGFDARLISRSDDGIAIEPLYREAHAPRHWRPEIAPWLVTQRIDHPDPAEANARAHEDLANGATGLSLVLGGAASAHGFGLGAHDRRGLAIALNDIRLDCISLRLEPGPHGRRAAEALAAYIDTKPFDPERLDLTFGMDPVGALAARGDLDAPWDEVARRFGAVVADLRTRHYSGPFATADGRVWHDGGATGAQELGFVLATALAYLRALESLDENALARAVSVTLAADQDMFLTLAKFRAIRLLWARLLEVSGLPATPLRLHAETSWRMMTARDPHANILRATAAVFGAGLGGADSISVLPFSAAQGLPDRFARRIARNIQNVLLAESHLWRIADPAGGAGYVEHLTDGLCARAWDILQSVERADGIVKALQDGRVQSHIAEARANRLQALAAKEATIVGVTAFTAPRESPPAIEAIAPVCASPKAGAAILIEPVLASRIAEPFENAPPGDAA